MFIQILYFCSRIQRRISNPSNINFGAFRKSSLQLVAINYFPKKTPSWYSIGLHVRLWNTRNNIKTKRKIDTKWLCINKSKKYRHTIILILIYKSNNEAYFSNMITTTPKKLFLTLTKCNFFLYLVTDISVYFYKKSVNCH